MATLVWDTSDAERVVHRWVQGLHSTRAVVHNTKTYCKAVLLPQLLFGNLPRSPVVINCNSDEQATGRCKWTDNTTLSAKLQFVLWHIDHCLPVQHGVLVGAAWLSL